jgi:hypothetical protein
MCNFAGGSLNVKMSQEDEDFDRLNSTVNFGRGAAKSPNRKPYVGVF